MRRPYPTDLSDAEWNYIEPHMPASEELGRPRIHSPREILNATFYVLRSGCQWRLLPHDSPKTTGVKILVARLGCDRIERDFVAQSFQAPHKTTLDELTIPLIEVIVT